MNEATVNVKMTIPQLDVIRDIIKARAELFAKALTEIYTIPGTHLSEQQRKDALAYERQLHALQTVADIFGVNIKG